MSIWLHESAITSDILDFLCGIILQQPIIVHYVSSFFVVMAYHCSEERLSHTLWWKKNPQLISHLCAMIWKNGNLIASNGNG